MDDASLNQIVDNIEKGLDDIEKENNVEFDAIGYKTMTTGSFPMWHMTIEALALKYTE